MINEELADALMYHQGKVDLLSAEQERRLAKEQEERERSHQAQFFIKNHVMPLCGMLTDEEKEYYTAWLIAANFTRDQVTQMPERGQDKAVRFIVENAAHAADLSEALTNAVMPVDL